ncbi:MAG: carbon starvation CstA family protein [Candidatus Latescibacterota bacterium]
MSLLTVVLICALCLLAGYLVYGRYLSRLLRLDPNQETPAVALRDDVDYVPISSRFLIGQHFSAIAAAGPIVGPILAGVMFGWVPALLWILLGAIFVGGVHDMFSLVASVRHKARSIAEVVREHMTRRAYLLFLAFIWFTLVYVIVAFTDITAASFLGMQELENGEKVLGGGIATSSLLYLALPVAMGLLMRYAGLSLRWATLLFLPLVGLAIWAGQYIPLDLGAALGLSENGAHKVWDVLLLLYCFAASIIPMWLLLQPRGHLGGYFLLISLVGGALGILFGGKEVLFPAFKGWFTPAGVPLFPMLFITVACGACSGFHAIVASGTTSKQLCSETDARTIGYGAMLLEGMVAVVSLCCVMMLAADAAVLKAPKPNFIYALGIGSFLEVVGIDPVLGISFGLMAFTTFVYDTLDVCTRLGRYIFQELLGLHGRAGRWVATAVTAGTPLLFVMQTTTDAAGRVIPVWRVFWDLFGASNQLLAALTLVGVSVWLWNTRRSYVLAAVSGLPAAWMYGMSVWSLGRLIWISFSTKGLTADPVLWVSVVLVALAFLILTEAISVFLPPTRPVSAPREASV